MVLKKYTKSALMSMTVYLGVRQQIVAINQEPLVGVCIETINQNEMLSAN